MNRGVLLLVLIACSPAPSWSDDPRDTATDNDVVVLETSRLKCLVGTNQSFLEDGILHKSGYNGIFRIESQDQASSPFVPAYAGWNLEHFFDARARPERRVFFEPRYAPMSLRRISENQVELHQQATKTYGVESWTRFEACEPYYVDFTFRCIPRRDDLRGDFLGIFWASYINGPIDKSIYFLDADSNLEQPMWRQLSTQAHNRDSTIRSKNDELLLEFEQSGNTLFSSFSPLRYAEPFFYGRFKNMVLIYVFRPVANLRFTHSPSGGGVNARGDDTNPAWDFQLIIPNVEVGKEYRLVGRMVYKSWQGRADVLREVDRFLALEPTRNES